MNNIMPVITIIIPTYNSDKYLVECLDSVKNQTYKNIEVIIIDGGSTDSTFDIIKTYCLDERWHFFNSKKGVSAQRNVGLENANGEYIYFLDSDDYINNIFLESLYNYLISNNLDFVTPEIVLASYKNDIFLKNKVFNAKIRKEITQKNFFIDGYDSCLAGPTKLYKKELIGKNRFDEKCAFGEDYLFNFSLTKNKTLKFGICDGAKYYYRKNEEENSVNKRLNSKSTYFFKKFLYIIKKMDKNSQNYINAKKLLKDDLNYFIEIYIKEKKRIPTNLCTTRLFFFLSDHSKKRWFYLFPKRYLLKQQNS